MRLWMLVLVGIVSLPAFGRDPQMTQWGSAVLANSSTAGHQINQQDMNHVSITWEVPMFRMQCHERMTIKVIPSGNTNFSGISASEFASWTQASLLRQAQSLGPVRNISVFQGSPCKGDLVLEVSVRIVSGRDFNRNTDSSSHSESWRGGNHEASGSNGDSKEFTGVYLTLQPILYRIGEGDQKEIVAAPAARISASDSEMTASAENFQYRRSDSYQWRRGSSSSSHSESHSSEWGNDQDMSRETQADGLVQRLSRQAICLTFQDLCQALQVQRYGEIKDREAAEQRQPETPRSSGGISYTVTQ